MVSLRRNDHVFNVNQKTREFFFECSVGEANNLTTDEIKHDVLYLLKSVARDYEWGIEKVHAVDIQMHLLDGDASVRVRGIINED